MSRRRFVIEGSQITKNHWVVRELEYAPYGGAFWSFVKSFADRNEAVEFIQNIMEAEDWGKSQPKEYLPPYNREPWPVALAFFIVADTLVLATIAWLALS